MLIDSMTDALPAVRPAALPEVLFSRLLEDALDAVIIIDEQCRICYINGAMQTLSGYASGELLGQPLRAHKSPWRCCLASPYHVYCLRQGAWP